MTTIIVTAEVTVDDTWEDKHRLVGILNRAIHTIDKEICTYRPSSLVNIKTTYSEGLSSGECSYEYN